MVVKGIIAQPIETIRESSEVAKSNPKDNQCGFGTNTKAIEMAQHLVNTLCEKKSTVSGSRDRIEFKHINTGINKIE
jgi:hypothetical protein